MTVLIKNSGDAITYRVEVDDIGPSSPEIQITGASFAQVVDQTSPETLPELVFSGILPDNLSDPKSVIFKVSGGEHGKTYQVTGTFTLSGSSPQHLLARSMTIRCFDS